MENIEVLHQVFAPLEVAAIGLVTESPRLRIGPVIDEDVTALRVVYEEALQRRLDRS